MLYPIYRLATKAASPFMPVYLKRRARHGKEDPGRIEERFGHTTAPRPEGRVVWVHASSIGEMNSVISLIEALGKQGSDLHFVLTTVTVTSARLAAQKLPPRTVHQYAPIDTPAAIGHFIEHWKPEAVLFTESELWPNMVMKAKEAGAHLFIINGRMSDDSFKMWSRFSPLSRPMLGAFDVVYAGSKTDNEKYSKLGAADVRHIGNLKYDTPPLACDEAALEKLKGQIGKRPVWLAASTHPGEEEQIVNAHRVVSVFMPELLTIIVPRHAVRGPNIAALVGEAGYTTALRSRGDDIVKATSFYIADTMGELGLFYRTAPVTFIGGSLVPHGGQNLIEPAQLGSAILCGPHMENFAEMVETFRAAKALDEVTDSKTLAAKVRHALTEKDYRESLTKAATEAAGKYQGLTTQLAEELLPRFKSN